MNAILRQAVPARADNPLKGKRILITGGAGFIGSNIADLLVDAGCKEIVIVDNMVRGRPENIAAALAASNNIKVITGDICDTRLMAGLVEGVDTVFHQAALRITHCVAEPRSAFDVMIKATYDLAEQCHKAGVRKIVMASSASVYGMAEEFPTTERQHSYNNRTLYGAAKVFGEGLLRSFNEMYGLNYVCLRYFNVYGPRMDLHGRYTEVLVRWMERLEVGEAPIIFGDGLQTMDMLHVRDVARANILAALSSASDVALNVGSGTETSLLAVAHQLAHVMGKPDIVPIHREERAVNPVPRRLSDTEFARRSIGFETSIPLQQGLAELVQWWRSERTVGQNAKVA